MNPFENINIPNNEDWTSIECGSDLVNDINLFFEQSWRYLDLETSDGILDRLSSDIDACHTATRESFAALNTEIFENGVNIINWGVWEERLLPQIWVNKSELVASVGNLPSEYTFRVSGDWIIFSDMEWNPFINYNKSDNTYSEPGIFTLKDSMDDNMNWVDYLFAEAALQKWETDEAYEAIDDVLKEWTIQIDELENPAMQESISRLYDIELNSFQKALNYFIDKSSISLFHQNPSMRRLSSWDFQITAILENWEHHVVNFHPNGEVESEHVF